ncbi:hypothetical protein ES703_75500 [subsurface metagenome]
MSIKRIKLLNLAFLFIFLLITLFINFFHTEKATRDNDNCPACRFLHSTFTTSQINFFHLPPPSFSGILKTFESFNYTFIFTIDPSSRSPPQI